MELCGRESATTWGEGPDIVLQLLLVAFFFWVHHDVNSLGYTFPLPRSTRPYFPSLPQWTKELLGTSSFPVMMD